jgi:two-component system response regulator YesN
MCTQQGEQSMIDVLLIDDERHFLQSLAEGLELYSKKMYVITADNAEKALQIMKTAVVDVVVTDLNMPGMNGYELLHKLQESHPRVPVIIMSANCRSSVENRLAGLRIAEYIEKPLDLGEMANTILSAA